MKKGGIGVGSASMMLVFAVLCLTIFTLISLSSATSEEARTKAAEQTVKGYYEADTLAEYVLAGILQDYSDASDIKNSYMGVDVTVTEGEGAMLASYTCPISEGKRLTVEVSFAGDAYSINKWHMEDTKPWTPDTKLNVWPGF